MYLYESVLDRIIVRFRKIVSRFQSKQYYYSPPIPRCKFPPISHPKPVITIEDGARIVLERVGGAEAILGIRVEELSESSYRLEVDYKGNVPWSIEGFFTDAFQDAANFIPPLFIDTRVSEVSLCRFGDATDLYGQSKETLGSKITITRAGNERLNWEMTSAENLWKISRSEDQDVQVDLHPAILNEPDSNRWGRNSFQSGPSYTEP